jgi:hypothetical protein
MQPQFTSFNPYQQQAQQEAMQVCRHLMFFLTDPMFDQQAEYFRQQQEWLRQQQEAQAQQLAQQAAQDEWFRQQQFQAQQQQQFLISQPTGFGYVVALYASLPEVTFLSFFITAVLIIHLLPLLRPSQHHPGHQSTATPGHHLISKEPTPIRLDLLTALHLRPHQHPPQASVHPLAQGRVVVLLVQIKSIHTLPVCSPTVTMVRIHLEILARCATDTHKRVN